MCDITNILFFHPKLGLWFLTVGEKAASGRHYKEILFNQIWGHKDVYNFKEDANTF